MKKIVTNMTQLIGETPILQLPKQAKQAQIFAKLEAFNAGGSVKDRVALAMIEQAEAEGELLPGGTIVEATSGNTGIGLAMVAVTKGYHCILVMPETMSIERIKLMQAYGAEVILTPANEGMKGSIAKAEELQRQNGYFMPKQFNNAANVAIHSKTTAREIIAAFVDRPIDAFVAGVGTGGTLTGVGKELKEAYPTLKVIAVEPASSAVISGEEAGSHRIEGIGAGFVPPILQTELIDEIVRVTTKEAVDTARTFGQEIGFLAGISGGAALFAARVVADALGEEANVLTLLPDNGERYLSTILYEH